MNYRLQRRDIPSGGWAGWRGPLLATLVAAALRLPGLGRPHALVFDETYYVKDALSLLRYGYERKTVEGANELLLDGQTGIFTTEPEYVVHPPLGKWLIALGEQVFGATPFGWRIIVALLGVASVLVTARVARRLARSNTVGTVAGLLLALDGVHIAMSRTALLDGTLSFLVLCAFAVLIVDRDSARLDATRVVGVRWTRPSIAFLLGLALATKWSALYFAVAFVILMLWWDLSARQAQAQRRFDEGLSPSPRHGVTSAWARHDVLGSLTMPVIAVATYLTTWTGWLATQGGWGRDWLPSGQSQPTLLSPIQALLHYHSQMLSFHINLDAAHNYRANPWGWPLMLRPTSFFYDTAPTCGADSCSQEVIPLGNPVVWWFGVVALLILANFAAKRVHSAALPIIVAFAAGWVPWLFFPERTTFHFYSVVFVPYTAIAVALVAYIVTSAPETQRDSWNPKLIAFVFFVASLTAFFYPVLTGMSLTYEQWHLRMWLPGWV